MGSFHGSTLDYRACLCADCLAMSFAWLRLSPSFSDFLLPLHHLSHTHTHKHILAGWLWHHYWGMAISLCLVLCSHSQSLFFFFETEMKNPKYNRHKSLKRTLPFFWSWTENISAMFLLLYKYLPPCHDYLRRNTFHNHHNGFHDWLRQRVL